MVPSVGLHATFCEKFCYDLLGVTKHKESREEGSQLEMGVC